MEINTTHKPLVVKLGGSSLANQHAIMRDVLCLSALGMPLVLVHGGGSAINRWLHALALPVRFKQGLRVTDEATLDVVRMVLCGQVNGELVRLATHMGGRVVGLCGIDGGMIQAHMVDPDLGFVGEIETIHAEVLCDLLHHRYVPIVAPLALGTDGVCLNVNADQVAARLAAALGAETLLFLSDVAGIYQEDGTCLSTLTEEEAQHLIQRGVIGEGMIPKVLAALTAVQNVPRVMIVDGREPFILLRAAFEGANVGTTLRAQRPRTAVAEAERRAAIAARQEPASPCAGLLTEAQESGGDNAH